MKKELINSAYFDREIVVSYDLEVGDIALNLRDYYSVDAEDYDVEKVYLSSYEREYGQASVCLVMECCKGESRLFLIVDLCTGERRKAYNRLPLYYGKLFTDRYVYGDFAVEVLWGDGLDSCIRMDMFKHKGKFTNRLDAQKQAETYLFMCHQEYPALSGAFWGKGFRVEKVKVGAADYCYLGYISNEGRMAIRVSEDAELVSISGDAVSCL